jgi:uncharacterized protein YdeI (YjbR/CyaY-like superfamily)
MLLDEDPALRDAWERLTLGRRRCWLLHFDGAKQSETRIARIERATPQIVRGQLAIASADRKGAGFADWNATKASARGH